MLPMVVGTLPMVTATLPVDEAWTALEGLPDPAHRAMRGRDRQLRLGRKQWASYQWWRPRFPPDKIKY